MLEIRNLAVQYRKQEVISTMDIHFRERCITSIIGRNGSGKSTLLKAIAQLIPYKGKIILDGQSIRDYQTKELARKMSLVMQSSQLSGDISVYDLVSMGRYSHQKKRTLTWKDHEKIRWALEEVNLFTLQDRLVDELSGGQRQRAWIALALAQEGEYLLLDEPTTYLDLESQLEILSLIRRLQRQEKKTVIMVLHDINQVARFSDDIVAMEHGNIMAYGTVDKVMTSQFLSALYGLDIRVEHSVEYNVPQMISYQLRKEANDE